METENRKLIGEFYKNSQEIVRVYSYQWNGKDLIDARVWVLKDAADPGSAQPTKKGLCIRPDTLPELIDILQKAERAFNRNGEVSA